MTDVVVVVVVAVSVIESSVIALPGRMVRTTLLL